MNFTSLEGCRMTGMTSDQWIFGVPLPWSRVKTVVFFFSASIVFVVDLYEKMFLHHPESNCNHFFFGI
jgi:hypothetical protein